GTDNIEFDGGWTVIAGCTQEAGGFDMDFPLGAGLPGLVTSRVRIGTSKINPLVAERVKALLAARREHTH
ncbi:MAG: hypothetical protein WBE21_13390, partial [Candidatus Acidiferrales bacterium]